MISNHRWECFASYTLAVLNATDHGADLSRESWHRFSSKPSRAADAAAVFQQPWLG